jgi:aryl-alcohol dehydrogenase-like predicted oxidoreductase
MNYRPFGKLNWSVSEIGIGTWAFGGGGWGPQEDNDSRKALHTAIDHGINFIDTAQMYGRGRSEKIIGEVLKERTEEVFVATKVRRHPEAPLPFTEYVDANLYYPQKYIIEECENSLRRLGREYIDLYQFHNWASSFNISDELFEVMDKLKKDGKIRAVGVSVPDDTQDCVIGAIIDNRIDAVQLLYNIFEQLPQYNLLPVCEKYNTGVISRVPLFEGALTGKFSNNTRFHRDDGRRQLFGGKKMNTLLNYVEKVKSLRDKYCPDLSLAQYAIRFCLSHHAVSTVIPGMRKPEQILHNIQAIDQDVCSEKELRELRSFANVRTIVQKEKSLSTAIIHGLKRYIIRN